MAEPVSLATAKAHLRVLDNNEDTPITGYIKAAREWVENYTGHVLVQREITEQRDQFGSFIELHRRPVLDTPEVEIAYVDTDGTEQAYADAVFQSSRFPARIYPALDGSWPSLWEHGGVTVTYTAGYEAGEEPQQLLEAMLVLIAGMHANRGTLPTETTKAAESLCDPYRAPGL